MGQECTVRIPGVCNFNPETTVLAHLNGYGMGGKHHDFLGAHCCSSCHSVIDGHTKSDFTPGELKLFLYEGIFRTQGQLFDAGLIVTRGSR